MNRTAMDRMPLLLDMEAADAYLDGLALSVECARLNDFYPPSETLLNSLDALMPETNFGLFPKVEFHSASGMPTYKEFVRVAADKDRAQEEMSHLVRWKDAKKRSKDDEIYDRLSSKYRYYQELAKMGPLLLESKKVSFRKIDKASSMALFRIVLDRMPLYGTVERLTVELRQHNTLWGRAAMTVDRLDAAAMSDSIGGLVYRMASLDVEVIYVRLNDDPNFQVESVTKGIIGPYVSSAATPEPPYTPLLNCAKEGSILNLSFSTASSAQAADVFNDPFQKAPQFSMDARRDLEREAGRAPYHVMTDRKFVLCRADRAALVTFLKEMGTFNIIYEAKE